MAATENTFSVALAKHERRELSEAFDFCNRQDESESYDRTALGRWLEGQLPTRGTFIARLANRLDDLGVYQAWVEATADTTPAEVKAAVSRFQGLRPEDKAEAFSQIREHFAETSASVRRSFSMRVDLYDSGDADLYELRVAVNWIGRLPAGAEVAIVNSDADLAHAFDQSDCIFRDVVELDDDRFTEALAAETIPKPSLNCTPLNDPHARPLSLEADEVSRGRYRFHTVDMNEARIMVRVSYPFPRGILLYPIRFKGYEIYGPATITLALHSQQAHTPRSHAFLTPGGLVTEATPLVNELVINAGDNDSMLGAGSGIMLHWSERA